MLTSTVLNKKTEWKAGFDSQYEGGKSDDSRTSGDELMEFLAVVTLKLNNLTVLWRNNRAGQQPFLTRRSIKTTDQDPLL